MGWGPKEEEDTISGGGGRTVILQFERRVLGTLFIENVCKPKSTASLFVAPCCGPPPSGPLSGDVPLTEAVNSAWLALQNRHSVWGWSPQSNEKFVSLQMVQMFLPSDRPQSPRNPRAWVSLSPTSLVPCSVFPSFLSTRKDLALGDKFLFDECTLWECFILTDYFYLFNVIFKIFIFLY